MEMLPAYMGAVEEALPEAAIALDKSQLKKHLNETVDKISCQEHRQLSAAGNLILIRTKYLWLGRHEDLRQRAAAQFRKASTPSFEA